MTLTNTAPRYLQRWTALTVLSLMDSRQQTGLLSWPHDWSDGMITMIPCGVHQKAGNTRMGVRPLTSTPTCQRAFINGLAVTD